MILKKVALIFRPAVKKSLLIFFSIVFTTLFLNTFFPSDVFANGKTYFGMHLDGVPEDMSKISKYEEAFGHKIEVIHYFQDWTISLVNQNLYNIKNHGSIPLISWIPAEYGKGVNQTKYRLDNITNGNFDSYIRASARAARDTGVTIWLRPFHEMNGNWVSYGGTVNGNEPGDFIPAWRHVVNIFKQEGANNVKFVWSPNANSIPNTPENAISKYFPGDYYVDIIGIDGYNWGTVAPSWNSKWYYPTEIFTPSINEIRKLSQKPIIFAETSSVEDGGSKDEWIEEIFDYQRLNELYSNFMGVIWYNKIEPGRDGRKLDFRLNSNEISVKTVRRMLGVENNYYYYLPNYTKRYCGWSLHTVIQNVSNFTVKYSIKFYSSSGKLIYTLNNQSLSQNQSVIIDPSNIPLPYKWKGHAVIEANGQLSIIGNQYTSRQGSTYRSSQHLSTLMYFPNLGRDYYGWSSSVIIQNPNNYSSKLYFHFYNPNGSKRYVWSKTVPANGGIGLNLMSLGALGKWKGSLWVESSRPVMGVVNNHTSGEILSYSPIYRPEREQWVSNFTNNFFGWNSILIAQNLDSKYSANVRIYVKDLSGNTVKYKYSRVYPNNIAYYSLASLLGNTNPFRGQIYVDSDGKLATIVQENQDIHGAYVVSKPQNKYYMPYIINRSNSWKTALFIINSDNNSTNNIKISYYKQSGQLVKTQYFNLNGGASKIIAINRYLPDGFVGTAVVEGSNELVATVKVEDNYRVLMYSN